MKKLTFSILFVLFLFPTMSYAQDWRCVRDTVKAFFVDNTALINQYSSNTMWAVSIDSVRLDQGYTYFYEVPIIRNISYTPSGSAYYYCYDPFGAPRTGIAVSAGESGTYFFTSAGDAFRICTDRQLNQPWNCISITDTSYLEGVINYMGIGTVLGVADSVKWISFQAKRNITEELLPHPLNNYIFKISKHFGMLTLYDFYQFPNFDALNSPVHSLAGIVSQSMVIGEQNLTLKAIYSFGLGDIYHTYYQGWSDPHSTPPSKQIIHTVLDSIWNSTKDTVTYKTGRFIHEYNIYDFKHHYYNDTIFESYVVSPDASSEIDSYPEQTNFYYNTAGTLSSVKSNRQQRSSAYNLRWVKKIGSILKPYSFCADTLVGKIIDIDGGEPSITSYYIEGLGGPYYDGEYTDWSHDPHSTFYHLVYFKKGTETWGTPFNTTNWHDPNSIVANETKKLKIYPNPSGDFVTIEIPGSEKGKFLIEIADLTGVKIDELNFEANKFTFPVSNYSKGMYILKLYKDGRLVGEQKLIKQ